MTQNSSTTQNFKTTTKRIEDLKLYDIRRKMNLAQHIITACMSRTINKNDISQNHFYAEAQNYITTSNFLMNSILVKINNKDKPKTFSDWFEERLLENSEDLNNVTVSLDTLLRHSIINHYLNKQCLPSYTSICNELKTKGINMTVEQIRKTLKKKGFKSQRLPQTSASIVVENPEQRFNRMKYLHNIMQFREANLHIVYIEVIVMSNEDRHSENSIENNETILIFVAVSSLIGIISIKFENTTIYAVTHSTENIETICCALKDWILNNVLPHLSAPSVIVLENRHINNTKNSIPTMYSKKSDMMNWLNENNIPYSSEMHSADLFELIKRIKRTTLTAKHKLDEILMAHGCKVIRRPRHTPYLNIFNKVWIQLQNALENNETSTKLRDLIKVSLCSIDLNDWKQLEIVLIKTEKKVYSDDHAVDEVIDKLFTYAKYATLPYIFIYQCDEDTDEIKMAEIVQD